MTSNTYDAVKAAFDHAFKNKQPDAEQLYDRCHQLLEQERGISSERVRRLIIMFGESDDPRDTKLRVMAQRLKQNVGNYRDDFETALTYTTFASARAAFTETTDNPQLNYMLMRRMHELLSYEYPGMDRRTRSICILIGLDILYITEARDGYTIFLKEEKHASITNTVAPIEG